MNVMASAVSILQRRDPSSADLLKHALSAGREHMESLRLVIPPSAPEMVFSVNLNELLRDVLEVSTPACCAPAWSTGTRPPPCRPCWAARCSCGCSSRRWWITPSRPWTPRAGNAAS
jgi:hypothetical protein